MKISARNRLKCKVREIHEGVVTAEVVLDLPDGQRIESTITRRAVAELALKPGMEVYAIIKASNVMIGVGD